ncbi:MAG: DNA-binding transcriptional regulator YhcF (GntR family) [Candidatus Paceibacteria bacterium]|jgi:DNA-binding transcriptional regulator YhcF (GntR family)
MTPIQSSDSIDPESPVPLYHQIAEAIRARIVRGELRAGDVLDPMRSAADRWGVNLHTVRHAYAALARDGLLEMRSARGTRVTGEAARLQHGSEENAEAFVARFVHEAAQKHELSAPSLAAMVASHGTGRRPAVTVVECNAWQCESHVQEMSAAWEVDASSWPLTNTGEPAGDAVVSTYFHYNDVRRRWPHLLRQVIFLTVQVDEQVLDSLRGLDKAVVLERDLPTAEAVAADLRAVLDHPIELIPRVSEHPSSAVGAEGDGLVLCSPRIWSELDEAVRARAHCQVIRYRFDEQELKALALRLSWQPAELQTEKLK